MKAKSTLVSACLAACALWGQAKPARPEFEVASVKPAASNADLSVNIGVHVDGSQVHFGTLALKDYIRVAYRVRFYQVVGPDWLASERFNIDAKLPEGGTRDQVPEMLQALLEDRFHMKTHREPKEFPVYGLVVLPSGSKMKEVPPDPGADGVDPAKAATQVAVTGGREGVNWKDGFGGYFHFGDNKIEAKKLPMLNFVDIMGRFVDRPIVDMTNLPGRYDFQVDLTQDDYNAMLIRSAISAGVNLPPQALRLLEGADGSLFAALKPLGLKLETKKAPIEVVVVDSMQRTPSEN